MAKVRLQNLRNFTVQIRRPSDDTIIGTGIAVSMDGKVVTCAHVVKTALGVHPREANGAEVGVYFSQVRSGETKARRATVAAFFSQYDDDVVLLKLVGGPAPLAPEQIPALGTAEYSLGNEFRSFGYRRLANYQGLPALGQIVDYCDKPSDRTLHGEPIMLASQHIDSGMSGAAVLDIERNLVVGVIAETWDSGQKFADRDTNFAVDTYVLTFKPLGLPMQDEPLPKGDAPQPKTDIEAARNAVAPELDIAWNNAPAPLEEWVGREDLLQAISADWKDPGCRVTGLIGFGGEGKSSLARKWVEELLLPTPDPSQEGNSPLEGGVDDVFWWGFYTKPNVEEFFEAALEYLSGRRIDPRDYQSTNAKVHFIAGMLYEKRCIFVLDGLEILQHQEGDQYGLLKSNDLREFLSYFADPKQQSFCLITSRAPVLDLMEYTTYTHRDVTRLSPADGRALLRKIGVQGDDAALDKIVTDWDGHALTLSLLGAYLVDQHGGDAAQIDDIPKPTADEERYERVHRVLRRYDEHLTETERAFLTLFSAFRTPVEESAFENVFRAKVEPEEPEEKCSFLDRLLGWREKRPARFWKPRKFALNAPIAALDDKEFEAMIERLVTYRILRYNSRTKHYTTHPLIRAHYFNQLTKGDRTQAQNAHEQIKDYYLELAPRYTPRLPKLDYLIPLIEAVHHACRAGAYDDAWQIYKGPIQHYCGVLTQMFSAWDTDLSLIQEFFPDSDILQDPQVSDPEVKGWILSQLGVDLMVTGHLDDAELFIKRGIAMSLKIKKWYNASVGYLNLSELYLYLGELASSMDASRKGQVLGQREKKYRRHRVYKALKAFLHGDRETAGEALYEAAIYKGYKRYSFALQGWVAHLQGDMETADKAFMQTLFSIASFRIWRADYLRRTGKVIYARRLMYVYQYWYQRKGKNLLQADLSRSQRVLGDLDADTEQHESARRHYDNGVKIARGISDRPALIEALLAQGRWFARFTHETPAAFSDLREALDYALNGDYRIYEADIRIALAWAHLAALRLPEFGRLRESSLDSARAEAQRALQMSTEMGYYWGKIDAEEVLQELQEKISR